jgi:hypothetical protein
VAEERKNRNAEIQNRESGEILFPGGKVIQNWAGNRIQILFDEKPDSKTITTLKSNAFRWSPKAGVWQRQNTNDAVRATLSIINNLNSNNHENSK